MSRRITPLQYAALCRALAAGRRHADIARELQLSPWTIARVADDLRRFDIHPPAVPLPAELPRDEAPPLFAPGQLRRCPGCGGMVYLWPCLACRMAARLRPPPPPAGQQPRS